MSHGASILARLAGPLELEPQGHGEVVTTFMNYVATLARFNGKDDHPHSSCIEAVAFQG